MIYDLQFMICRLRQEKQNLVNPDPKTVAKIIIWGEEALSFFKSNVLMGNVL